MFDIQTKNFKKATRTYTDYKHVFAVILLLNAALIFFSVSEVPRSMINEVSLCGDMSNNYLDFANSLSSAINNSSQILDGVKGVMDQFGDEITEALKDLIVWRVRQHLIFMSYGITCFIDALGDIAELVEAVNSVTGLLDGGLSGTLSICDYVPGGLCSIQDGNKICFQIDESPFNFQACTGAIELPSLSIDPSDLGLTSQANDTITEAILGELYDLIIGHLGDQIVKINRVEYDLNITDDLAIFYEFVQSAENSCIDFVRSPTVEGAVSTSEKILWSIGFVSLLLAIAYPIVVTAISYGWNSFPNSNFLKKFIQRLQIASQDEELPFASYVLNPPTLVTLVLSVALAFIISGLFIAQSFIDNDLEELINVDLRLILEDSEKDLAQMANEKLATILEQLNEFLDAVNKSGMVLSDDLDLAFESYNSFTDDIENSVPVIGTYVVDIVECLFPFLEFDQFLDDLNSIRSDVILEMKNATNFQLDEENTAYTDSLIASLEIQRQELGTTVSSIVYSIIIRSIPIFIAFPFLLIQGVIFLAIDCCCPEN